MSRKTIMVAVLSLSLLVVGAGLVQAHGGRSGGGYGAYGQGYGCDGPRGSYGQGMMGYGQGQGMMGYGMRGHMGWDGDDRGRGFYRGERSNADVSQDEAKAMIELRVSRNPYLKVGKVTANDDGFEIQVVTKKGGDLVNRLQIEKSTGRIFPIFE